MSPQKSSRISLRRKRCNEFESNEPSPKRISPAKKNQVVSHQAKNEKKEIIEPDQSLIATTFMTPKGCNKRGVKRIAQTPKTHREIEADDSLENKNEVTESEFSLSQSPSQFPSSQIPSSQDWEVVWDCNSPGYSKEELKKMGDCQSDKLSSSSPVVQVPNRLHLSKLRRPILPLSPIHLPSRLNSKNSLAVAAELDSLLIKVNGERIQQDQESSDDSEPLPSDVSNLLNASSQPFDVSNLEEENLNNSLHNQKEKKDDKDSQSHDQPSISSEKNVQKQENHETKAKFLSFDDDDLFSESFLMSSQALEESVLRKESETQKSKLTSSKNFSPLSRIRKKTPTVISDTEEKLGKSNDESTAFPVKPKSFKSCKVDLLPSSSVSSTPIMSSINRENISSVTNSISEFQNKAKPNLQTNSETTGKLNNKTSDKSLIKMSGFKNKPRATFQLNMPSNQSLHQLFTSKVSNSENLSTLCIKNEFATSDNSHTLSASSTEKFNRSKSESSHSSANVAKMKSCNSSIESNFGASVNQELDDDDEIFASLMPALIEVEAEHVKRLSQEFKIKNEVTATTGSDLQSTVNSSSIPSVSVKTFSFNNNCNQYSQLKSSNVQTKRMTNSTSSSSSSDSSRNIQGYNKSLSADKFPTTIKSSVSEEATRTSEGAIKSCIANQKTGSKCEIVKRTPQNKQDFADSFEDEDDDDIFLQDGVLDYLSQVESQFISSQSSSQKSDAKPATLVKESSSSDLDSADSFFPVNTNENLCKVEVPLVDISTKNRSESDPFHSAKNRSEDDLSEERRYQKSVDRGSKKLVNEFVKVSETAAKLKRALNCDSSINFNKEKVISKRASPRRSDPVKSPQNLENVFSDEDMFSIVLETSMEDLPTKSSVDQIQKDEFSGFKKGLQPDFSSNSSRSNNNNNNNNSLVSNLQSRFRNTHNTRSKNIAPSSVSQLSLSNRVKPVSKPKVFSAINTRGTNRFNMNNKSNNK